MSEGRSQPAEPDLERGAVLGLQLLARRRKGYKMFEEMPYLQPQPGTGVSRPAWRTAPEVHTHAPVEGKRDRCRIMHVKETCSTSEKVLYLWRWVLQYNCEERERWQSTYGRVGDEGGPVPIQSSLLYAFHDS